MAESERRLYWELYRAVRRGRKDEALRLLRDNVELHTVDGRAGRPLDLLSRERPEWLEDCLEAGLHPDSGESHGTTLLQHAVAGGETELVALLLRFGADTERRNESGETALGYACSWGQLEAARLLLEAGATVNAIEDDPKTGYRCTALDCAQHHPEIVQLLRSCGAMTLDELEADPGR